MITFHALVDAVPGLQAADLRRWIDNAWVRPLGVPPGWQFEEIDVARVRLIVEFRDELRVDEETLPVVLSLLDQLHAARRQLVTVHGAISEHATAEIRDRILQALRHAEPGD